MTPTSAEIRADLDRLASLLDQAAAIAANMADNTGDEHYKQFADVWRIQARILREPLAPANWRSEHEHDDYL